MAFDGDVVPTRYTDFDGIVIDETRVPPTFRHLTDDAIEWSISDDVERDEYMTSLSMTQLQSLVDAVSPHFHAIADWCKEGRSSTPVSDEIVIFDQLLEAVAEAAIALGR